MSTPAQWVSMRELVGRRTLVAPLRRIESSSSAEPVMAAAACRARERPRSSGSSLSRASALAEKPRAVEVEGQSGSCGEDCLDGASAGAELGAGADADVAAEVVLSVADIDCAVAADWAAGAGR